MSMSPESMERVVRSARLSRADVKSFVLLVVLMWVADITEDDREGVNATTEVGRRASAVRVVRSGNFIVLDFVSSCCVI